ncbi:AAA family ATPase [Chloroflexota bacterium]
MSLRNFMCYRDTVPTISFDGLHLICLSGDNGNGKSALIDAMTWALWGKTRAQNPDDLITANQKEAEVEFEFAIGQQVYRIIRKRTRARSQKTSGVPTLDFQIATNGGFKSISGNSISQTEQKITAALHMDYQTFINSAYLRQGHADEFTQKRPAERKEVLGNILDLSRYDQLADQAREMERQQKTSKMQMENTLQELAAEIARKPEYEAALAQAESMLANVEAESAVKAAKRDQLRFRKEALEKQQVELEQLTARNTDNRSNLASWEEQGRRHRSHVMEYEEVIAQRQEIETGFTLFAKAKESCEELDRKFRQVHNLEQQKFQMEKRIDQANQELNTEHRLLQQKINDLTIKTENLSVLQNQRKQYQEQLAQLSGQEESIKKQENTGQDLQTRGSYLEAQKAQLEQEIREIGDKLDLLAARTEAKCPLCETELGTEGLSIIRSKYEADKQNKTAALATTQSQLKSQQQQSVALQQEISRLKTQLHRERVSLEGEIRVFENKIAEAEAARSQLAEARSELDEIEQRLARKDYAHADLQVLQEIEAALLNLGYHEESHRQAQAQLQELGKYDLLHCKLEEADKSIIPEKEAAARATETIEKLKQNLVADEAKKQQLQEALIILPSLRESLEVAERENKEMERQCQQARETMWQAKTRLERCQEMATRKGEKEKQLVQVNHEESIYRELAEAFGKRGIQALLIEMALPEIEEEANRLLSRMTDNRMHVKFATQRPTRKGETTETLDINIADELGTRNYEMFSGGEAFRINFAIRIALSRLLAKRAGAPLATLIIDEGFGTQDSTGIEKLKEAITSIQEDFEKIIVITHIEELRDSFTNRIDVVKTAEGSTFSLN